LYGYAPETKNLEIKFQFFKSEIRLSPFIHISKLILSKNSAFFNIFFDFLRIFDAFAQKQTLQFVHFISEILFQK